MKYSIEIKNLSYQFSNENILLKDIDLKVPRGSIFGFLGENGAGKTTTLRLILGLLKLQKGDVVIFGKNLKRNRTAILKDVGSLIESPSFYGHLSAEDNFKVLQKIYQFPKERIETVLNLVGLSKVKGKKVKQFSLGMKQRLGIGITLLHQPKLLILDEPTNGLDPNGIIEIRNLLLDINSSLGTTIVISSHLLSEIEKLVTHLAIINSGKIVFQDSLEALELKQREISNIKITTDNSNKAYELISNEMQKVNIEGETVTIPNIPSLELAKLIRILVLNNLNIYQVVTEKMNLESAFINLTKD